MPPKESMSAAATVAPSPVNGRTTFGRVNSSSNMSAVGASSEPSVYRGPFGHVGVDPFDDPAAATHGQCPFQQLHLREFISLQYAKVIRGLVSIIFFAGHKDI